MAGAQTNLEISYFNSSSGELVFGEVQGATNYYVLWTSDLSMGWTNLDSPLNAIPPGGNGSVTCSVPLNAASSGFFKVGAELDSGVIISMEMVMIASNQFLMGSVFAIDDSYGDENPTHFVNLDAYSIGAYEVTWSQWDQVRGWALDHGYNLTAGSGKDENHPVQQINWFDAVKWCNALSELEGLTPCYTVTGAVYRTGNAEPECNWSADGYRLPTEAEWEWAARGEAGGTRFPWDESVINHDHANYLAFNGYAYDNSPYNEFTYHPTYSTNSYPYTSPVGSFPANASGLYDVSGNVMEFCWDWYVPDYYAESPTSNPHGPSEGSSRILRGGSWASEAFFCRLSARADTQPDIGFTDVGFRVCRTTP